MTKQEAKEKIAKLVEKYQNLVDTRKVNSYNEAQTRNEFIEPLFEFLGWDMRNLENPSEVTTEETVSKGRVDLAFRLNHIPVMFLEAKALKVDLDEWKWAEQAINYSWNKSVTWAILSDFEGIKIFNAEIPPKSLTQNLFFELKWHEYIDRFDQLWLLSKESFEEKKLFEQAEKWGKLTKRKQVGEKLFEDLTNWRTLLTKDFKKNNSNIDEDAIDEGVQKILDRLIFIRTAEDRKIEQNILLSLVREWETSGKKHNIFKRLNDGFRWFDDHYNSKLFASHALENWKADDKVFETIIKGLYQTADGYRYDFSAISTDVLGGIYEQYLGYVQGKRQKEERTKSKRKSQGIYYTPKYVVEYLIEQTLGEVLKQSKSKDIPNIKILDPACGSGSFLISAYDKILEAKNKLDKQIGLFDRFEILKNNIYGVDLDEQAIEIAQLNLLLRVLQQRTKLPTLSHNLRIGNSLVEGDHESLNPYFDQKWRNQQPFNFKQEFPEVFKEKAFDVIIGNPPYVQLSMSDDLEEGMKKYLIDHYESSMGRLNTFAFFIRRGLDLLSEGGYLGFIIPNTILTQDYYYQLRKYILDHCAIENIVSFDDLPFKDAVVENVIIILKKTSSERKRNSKKVKIIKIDEKLSFKKSNSINQKLFYTTNKYSFNINLSETNLQIKKKIEVSTKPLNDYLCINQAIALKHDRAKYLSKEKLSDKYKPVLDGRNINRYSTNWDGTYLKYDINAIHSCKREDIFQNPSKIFFRRVGAKLTATYDDRQFYALNTLVVMNLKTEVQLDIKFFLALFNSKLLNFYYLEFLKSTKKVFSEIQARQVAQLPIREPDLRNEKTKRLYEEILSLSSQMIDLQKEAQETTSNTDKNARLKTEIEKIDEKIDKAIYKLYELTDEEIETIEKQKIVFN